MLGLGESEDEIFQTINDLYFSGCKILTIGQYLQPGKEYMEVVEYVVLKNLKNTKYWLWNLAFHSWKAVRSVRSSFHAENHIKAQ
jgi:lipoic acid synthetase